MTPGRKVFIPNVVFLDYDPAKPYGKLIGLTRGGIDSMDVDKLYKELEEKLNDHDFHAEDFVLLSGAPLINVMVVTIFMQYHDQCKMLQWDGVLRDYKLVTQEFGCDRDRR